MTTQPSTPLTATHTLSCEDATRALGAAIAHIARSGDVFALEGLLGAGKTTLTRAIAAALGASGVSSPTFVLVNQYPLPPGRTLTAITHVDAYRLTSTEDLDTLGWDTLFEPTGQARAGTIALIEWPDRLTASLPADLATISLRAIGQESREVILSFPASWKDRPGVADVLDRPPIRCRTTGEWVAPTTSTYPFANERARMADLHGWFSESYKTTREIDPEKD